MTKKATIKDLKKLAGKVHCAEKRLAAARYERAKAASGKPKRNGDAIEANHRVFDEIARRSES